MKAQREESKDRGRPRENLKKKMLKEVERRRGANPDEERTSEFQVQRHFLHPQPSTVQLRSTFVRHVWCFKSSVASKILTVVLASCIENNLKTPCSCMLYSFCKERSSDKESMNNATYLPFYLDLGSHLQPYYLLVIV